jgi:hypothetical protein
MSSIQDIHALEQRISDIVEDYIKNLYDKDDVLAIGLRCGKITMKVDEREAIKIGKTTEIYPLKELVRKGNHNKPETDNDKISEIVNCFLFID